MLLHKIMSETAIQLSTICSRSNDVLFSEIDREFVLMSLAHDQYFGMDGVAAAIWEILANAQSVADIVRNLLGRYHISETQCRQETIDFLQILLDHGLVEIKNE